MVCFVGHFVSLIFCLTFQYDSEAYERDRNEVRTNMFAHVNMCFWFFAGMKGKKSYLFCKVVFSQSIIHKGKLSCL